MSEATDLQNRIIEAVQKEFPKSRLFRQNVGKAYPLTTFERAWAFLKIGVRPPWFRPVSFGTVGMGDLGGWIQINGVAVCLHIEAKVGADKMSDEQLTFQRVLTGHGGIYIEARDVSACLAEIRERIRASTEARLQ